MKQTIPCEIIRDLLPLYTDHLLSKESEEHVRAHLETCEECRKIYERMNMPEPVAPSETASVDYMKKIKKNRTRIIGILALAAALIITGTIAFFGIRASKPQVSYNKETYTVVIHGKSGYENLKLPAEAENAVYLDAQDDNFHMSVYLPVLRLGDTTRSEFIPSYLERTDKSLAFLHQYLHDNAPEVYSEATAKKFTEFSIRDNNAYNYKNESDRIFVELGNYYWHREELYLLAIMNTPTVEWQQLGYAWYLGNLVNPYSESSGLKVLTPDYPYYEAFVKMGGDPEFKSPQDNRILYDAIAHVCLVKGMHWGTAYESYPVYETAFYKGAKKALGGNTMSVAMASSFIAYLCETYGFDKVSSYCFGKASFEKAFGLAFNDAYEAWTKVLLAY